MDTKNFIDVLIKHISPAQVAAILKDFKDPDPAPGYCVVCGEQDLPLDAAGNVFVEDLDFENPMDPADYKPQHTENCPIMLLQQNESAAQLDLYNELLQLVSNMPAVDTTDSMNMLWVEQRNKLIRKATQQA
jgi:hypothetical protein